MRGRSASGFTLIEMLVVLAIIALIATAIPAIANQGDGPRTRAAARELSAELTALRDRAVRRRIVTALTIAEDNSGYVAGADGARHNLPAGLTLSYQSTRPPLVGDAPEQIVFYPDGSASGGAILVRRGDYAITIHVGWLDGRVWLDG